MRRPIVWLITFLGGLFFLLEFLLPERFPGWMGGFENPLTRALPSVTSFIIIVGTMAFLLGPFNLVRHNVGTVAGRKKGWPGSCVFLGFLVASILATAFSETDLSAAFGVPWDKLNNAFRYGVMTAFFASSMALLTFYLVSAAHRAFRLDSTEAAAMMVTAVIVLLGQVPLGDWLTNGFPAWFRFSTWTQWILEYPNAAVQRAVLFGACGGAFATGLRHWLGIGAPTE
jgi:hypothetical protein